MKPKIHPKYYDKAKVVCACGHTFLTGSTMETMEVEVCSACHPFFTGEMKYVDTLGRVEKFKQKQAASAGQTYMKKKQRHALKKKMAAQKAKQAPKTLRDMLKKTQNSKLKTQKPDNNIKASTEEKKS